MASSTKSTQKAHRKREIWKALFLEALRNSGNVRAACQAAGIDRSTAYKCRERSKQFREQWDEALEDACDFLEAVAWQRAQAGSDRLLEFLLKSFRPQKYKETVRQELTGADGGPIDIQNAAADFDSRMAALVNRITKERISKEPEPSGQGDS